MKLSIGIEPGMMRLLQVCSRTMYHEAIVHWVNLAINRHFVYLNPQTPSIVNKNSLLLNLCAYTHSSNVDMLNMCSKHFFSILQTVMWKKCRKYLWLPAINSKSLKTFRRYNSCPVCFVFFFAGKIVNESHTMGRTRRSRKSIFIQIHSLSRHKL